MPICVLCGFQNTNDKGDQYAHRVTLSSELSQRLSDYARSERQPETVIIAEAVRMHVGLAG